MILVKFKLTDAFHRRSWVDFKYKTSQNFHLLLQENYFDKEKQAHLEKYCPSLS